jgi:hypothetical protein
MPSRILTLALFVTILQAPSALSHLFIAGTGTSVPAEYQTFGDIAEEVITEIAVFITR